MDIIGLGCACGSFPDVDTLEAALWAGTLTADQLRAGGPPRPEEASAQALADAGYPALAGPVADACRSGGYAALKQAGELLAADADGGKGVLISGGGVAILVTRQGRPRQRVYARLVSIPAAAGGAGLEDVEYADLVPGEAGELAVTAKMLSAGGAAGGRIALGWTDPPARTSALLLAILKTSLCLYHCYLPRWTGPRWAAETLLGQSAGYLADSPRPWLRTAPGTPARALVGTVTRQHRMARIVLAGASIRADQVDVDWRRAGGPLFLPLAASSGARLRALAGRELARLTHPGPVGEPTAMEPVPAPDPAAQDRGAARAVFCAASPALMLRELAAGLEHLSSPAGARSAWHTRAGSCYHPNPIGPVGRVALVFPGMFTAYPGLGADLCRCFPGVIRLAEDSGDRTARLIRADWLYPRHSSADDDPAASLELLNDPAAVAELCAGYATAQTRVLREVLGVPVDGALGYSLGEISMVCALGDRAPFGTSVRDAASDLFTHWLGGRKEAVRELWDIPPDVPDRAVWSTRMLFADAAAVRERVDRYDRVFLTHVNTRTEVIIAGDPGQCRAVARDLDCPSMSSRMSYVLHCPVPAVAALTRRLAANMPTVGLSGGAPDLFSSRTCEQVSKADGPALLRNLADTLRSTVDFPRLVEGVYARGYRYFVEVGPGRTCTRWIGEILGARPHVAVSVNRRGLGTAAAMSHVLACLLASGVPVTLPAEGRS